MIRSRIDYVRDPIDGVGHSVVDARLTSLGARITGTYNANQVPAICLLKHKRSPRITLREEKQKIVLRNFVLSPSGG